MISDFPAYALYSRKYISEVVFDFLHEEGFRSKSSFRLMIAHGIKIENSNLKSSQTNFR